MGDLDWVAIPLLPYLYAVERAEEVPPVAGDEEVAILRERYRRAHLQSIAPDGPDGAPVDRAWRQLAGAAYDRRIVAFSVTTSPEQEDVLIAALNATPNRRRFNLLFRNCADFARDIVNRFHPGAVRSSIFADLGLTTPKQVAKALVRYGSRRPDAGLKAWVIPQVAGTRPVSSRPKGVLEGLLKTKRYSVPLAIFQPWIPVGLAAGYVVSGRFDAAGTAARELQPLEMEQQARRATEGGDGRAPDF